ncbi:hypothetical protein [Streptomyces sp. NPDC048172]|uniref:hypothetical protein n=1 Tax=Streptomyces sp. NPDC048172 TaxID=3365505 RepID=UPI0037249B27
MTNGDMRYGHCTVCGAHEVFRGEYTAQGALRQSGSLLGKQPVFDAYVCAACGHTQLHLRLEGRMASYVQRNLQWIPPYQGT